MRWTGTLYNPYTCQSSDRTLGSSHIIALPGTCTSASVVGIPVLQQVFGTHTWIEWGHAAGQAEQAAGVAIALVIF